MRSSGDENLAYTTPHHHPTTGDDCALRLTISNIPEKYIELMGPVHACAVVCVLSIPYTHRHMSMDAPTRWHW